MMEMALSGCDVQKYSSANRHMTLLLRDSSTVDNTVTLYNLYELSSLHMLDSSYKVFKSVN